MSITTSVRRGLVALAALGVMATLGVADATNASASVIPNGHIRICALGYYPVFIHVLPKRIPGGAATTRSFESPVVHPDQGSGSCWWNNFSFSTVGQTVQVDVVGLNSNGGEFYIGSEWWNSDTGLGISAEGSTSLRWLETW